MEIEFPTEGWRFASSNSYGAAMLYRDIPKVVVKEFSMAEREIAERTHQYLQDFGISSAEITEVTQADGRLVIYVFSERKEFIANLESRLPGLIISA